MDEPTDAGSVGQAAEIGRFGCATQVHDHHPGGSSQHFDRGIFEARPNGIEPISHVPVAILVGETGELPPGLLRLATTDSEATTAKRPYDLSRVHEFGNLERCRPQDVGDVVGLAPPK